MKKKILVGLATLIACTPNKNDCPTSTYEIPVGSFKEICQFEKDLRRPQIVDYAGMPSDKAFSLGFGSGSARINYFFPVDTKEFTLGIPYAPTKFKVDYVSPEKIKFTYAGDKN